MLAIASMADATTELRASRDYWEAQARYHYGRYSDMRRSRDRWVNATFICLVLATIIVGATIIATYPG